MKLKVIRNLIFIFIALCALDVNAALINGSVLDFIPIGTGGTSNTLPADGSGSWVAMEIVAGQYSIVPVTSLNGIVLGTTQLATYVPPFVTGNIDVPWSYFGNTGAHQSTSNTDVLSAVGDTAAIDFSGWGITLNSIPNIALDTGAWTGNAEGVANVVCDAGSGCGNGAAYSLDYSATVPAGDVSGFGGAHYVLHLEGTVSAVPLPATLWLFVSGLSGLIGVARRKVRV